MIPSNTLSLVPYPSTFSYPVKTTIPEDLTQGWELGGVQLNNNTQGLLLKVWHCTLEIDEATDIGSVYLQAPGTVKTLVFTGLGLTEVDGAFDQNMNPFIAYVQLGIAKYYWYDSIAVSMVHTSLPNTCRSPKCCLDEHRLWNVDVSDVILCYVDGTTLKMRYQRDRYAIAYTLLTGVVEDLIYIGMNIQSRVQFGLGYAE